MNSYSIGTGGVKEQDIILTFREFRIINLILQPDEY